MQKIMLIVYAPLCKMSKGKETCHLEGEKVWEGKKTLSLKEKIQHVQLEKSKFYYCLKRNATIN